MTVICTLEHFHGRCIVAANSTSCTILKALSIKKNENLKTLYLVFNLNKFILANQFHKWEMIFTNG